MMVVCSCGGNEGIAMNILLTKGNKHVKYHSLRVKVKLITLTRYLLIY